MNEHNANVEVLLLEQRVKVLESIAVRIEPQLNQILTAVQSLHLTMTHAAENHRKLAETVSDHERRIRANESRHNASEDHESRLRKIETAQSETWYLKPLSYAGFIAAIGAIASAMWKAAGH